MVHGKVRFWPLVCRWSIFILLLPEVTLCVVLSVEVRGELSLEARGVVGIHCIVAAGPQDLRPDPSAHLSKVDATRRGQRGRGGLGPHCFPCSSRGPAAWSLHFLHEWDLSLVEVYHRLDPTLRIFQVNLWTVQFNYIVYWVQYKRGYRKHESLCHAFWPRRKQVKKKSTDHWHNHSRSTSLPRSELYILNSTIQYLHDTAISTHIHH